MKDEMAGEVAVKNDRIITICMDVFGIDHRIDVDFDCYYSFLNEAYEVIESQGYKKARLIYNAMIGAISNRALYVFEAGMSIMPDEYVTRFKHDCYIATLLGNLLHVAPAYIKANWDFDAAIAEIDCPCCGEKLCSTSSN
jgi:hypothetical protein